MSPPALVSHGEASSFERVRRQALAYVEQHLSDVSLNVSTIAHHCDISERYLHAAFAACSQRLGAFIRERRLQQCRNELRDPACRENSIIEIAFRWGFEDAAHFSRAYKTRFGYSPRQERDQ